MYRLKANGFALGVWLQASGALGGRGIGVGGAELFKGMNQYKPLCPTTMGSHPYYLTFWAQERREEKWRSHGAAVLRVGRASAKGVAV